MRVELRGVDEDSLQDIVGTECYDRARAYVRQDAVVQQVWVPAQNALCGVVRGSHGEYYTPAVYFDGAMQVSSAQCSCTARYGCEHAAALLMSAARDGAATPDEKPAAKQASQSWEQSLDSLLSPASAPVTGPPLAIELSAESIQGRATRLMARLLHPGRNGNWVYGSPGWDQLAGYAR